MTTKRKIYTAISWILLAVCMGFIFYMSSRVATESQAMSDGLLKRISDLIGIEFSSFFIRKTAHALEFMGLAMLSFNAVYSTWEVKLTPIVAFLITAFYAASDEFHQIFVEGRACQLRDFFIDCSGAAAGIILSIIILKIIKKIRKRDKNGGIKTV